MIGAERTRTAVRYFRPKSSKTLENAGYSRCESAPISCPRELVTPTDGLIRSGVYYDRRNDGQRDERINAAADGALAGDPQARQHPEAREKRIDGTGHDGLSAPSFRPQLPRLAGSSLTSRATPRLYREAAA